MISDLGICLSSQVFIREHGEDATVETAMRAVSVYGRGSWCKGTEGTNA